MNLQHHKLNRDDLRCGEWVLSNVPSSRLPANKGGSPEQLHFKAADQGKLLTCGHHHSTICLKATLCFLDHGQRPKYTHSSFYDYKVSILLMVLSLFLQSLLGCVLLIPSPCFSPSSQLCSLSSLLPPSCSRACLPLFAALPFCNLPITVVFPSFWALGQVFSNY